MEGGTNVKDWLELYLIILTLLMVQIVIISIPTLWKLISIIVIIFSSFLMVLGYLAFKDRG